MWSLGSVSDVNLYELRLGAGRFAWQRTVALAPGRLTGKKVMPGNKSTVIAVYERFTGNSRALAVGFDRQGRAGGRAAKIGRPIKTTQLVIS